MSKPKIYIGADHNGFELKAKLIEYLVRGGYDVTDCGDAEKHPDDDFPVYASKVVQAMIAYPTYEVMGILLCGSGQGMCMAANRFKGVRAVLGYNQESVRMSRNDNDSNILCLPARELDLEKAAGIINTWLMTPFAEAPRFKRRLAQMDQLG